MLVLRSTMYPPPGTGNGPITTVLRETDLNCPLAEAIARMTAPLDLPLWVVADTFVVPPGTSIESATFEAQRRAGERYEDEKNMAIAFYWYLGALLRTVDAGVVSATLPAPLDADALRGVAVALAKQPAYRRQTLIQIACDGRIVRLANGEVFVEEVAR